MSESNLERRSCRSALAAMAIDFQLLEIKERDAVEALVIADQDGFVIAGVGDDDACEALAARAPFAAVGSSAGSYYGPKQIAVMRVAGTDFLVACTRGKGDAASALKSAGAGARRILRAA